MPLDIRAASVIRGFFLRAPGGTGVSLRRILGSFWTQALLWAAGLACYHFLMAALQPATGEILPETFPLYAEVLPVADAWVAGPVVVFVAWLLLLRRFKGHSGQDPIPIPIVLLFVLAMNVSMAVTRGGFFALAEPFTRTTHEYFGDIGKVSDVGEFLRNYSQLSPTLSLHSGTHPPGPVLYLWLASQLIATGTLRKLWIAVAATLIGTSLASVPFYKLARQQYGEQAARYALGMYVVTPSLVLFGATSMDGVFLLFPIVAAYYFHKSWKEAPIRYSIYTGLALAAGMMFTFATVCVGFVFTIEAMLSLRRSSLSKRIWKNLVYAGATFVAAYCLLFYATGYNLIDVLRTAMRTASMLTGSMYSDILHYFHVSVVNLAAFLIGAGFIAVALWWREVWKAWDDWRERRQPDFIAGGFATAIVVLTFSTLFTSETERVLMFLIPFVLLPAARNLDIYMTARPNSNAWYGVIVLLFVQTLATQLALYTGW